MEQEVADGTAELTFTHASEYTIIIDEKSMTTSPNAGDMTLPDTDGITSPKTGDIWTTWWILVCGMFVTVVAFFVKKDKKV